MVNQYRALHALHAEARKKFNILGSYGLEYSVYVFFLLTVYICSNSYIFFSSSFDAIIFSI